MKARGLNPSGRIADAAQSLAEKAASEMRSFPVIASAAKQSISAHGARWIASSQELLAMTGKQLDFIGYISSEVLRTRDRPSISQQVCRFLINSLALT
jgi:hypothetical protein